MKKSKVILAIALAIILVLTCISVPTFSWFTRPAPSSSTQPSTVPAGEKMVLGGEVGTYPVNAYNGKNVTIVTKSSETGVAEPDSYNTTCNDSASLSGSGIGCFNRKYFCTTITNGSGSEQNVSLYVRTLSIPTSNSNGSLALGVNGPTRSYRDYSSLATPSTKTTRELMRIYFEKDNSVTGWNGTEFYICYNEDTNTSQESLDATGSNGRWQKLEHVGGNNNPNQYYADIPSTATHAFFAVEGWNYHNNGNPDYWQRSQTLWDLSREGQTQTQSRLFKITNSNSNGKATVVRHDDINGNCINTYYDNIFVTYGNTFNAALSSDEYIGTLKYYSSDENVFTVDENTGDITPKNVNATATLYTKSTGGSYPDEQQVETIVHVSSAANYVFNDVMIVKNVKIPAANQNNENVVKVYWYVINNSPTNTLSYTIDNVYLSL